MNTRPLVLAMLAGLGFPTLSSATEQQGLVVTASRVAETADSALASVTVITREEIEASQAQTLFDVLRMQSGIDLTRSGGPGQQTSLFLRGTNSNQTLVLIDGVRAQAPTTGAFPWEQMSVAQIERIEIVRGPRSSLWGADAIGGVIQIFTRKPSGPTARIEGGSYGTGKAHAGWGGGSERLSASISAEYQTTDGFTAQNNPAGPDDRDGYRATSLTAGLKAQLAPNTRLDVRAWHNQGRVEFDYGPFAFPPIGFNDGRSDTSNTTANATLAVDVNDVWSQSLSLGLLNDQIKTPVYGSDINNRRYTVDWQHDLALSASHMLTLGVAYYRDEADYRDNFASYREDTDNTAGFVMWRGETAAGDLQLSVRHDSHSRYGGHTTEQFAWGFGDGPLRVTASIGTAFRAPNFNELFYPGFGNPDLEPERSRSVEAGVRIRPHQAHEIRVTGFDTVVENLIVGGTNLTSANTDARITGAEIEYRAQLGAWSLSANGTLQVPRDELNGRDLLRRPKRKLSIASGYRFGNGARIGGEWLLVGPRLDQDFTAFPARTVTLPGYGILNLNASYPIYKGLVLEGRVENLFDKDYQTVLDYNTPGASVYAALRYRR